MAILLLVRHGQNDAVGKSLAGRLPGVHLNEAGKAQASRLGEFLKDLPIKAVYASPLERTQETAQFIARPHHLSVETDSSLQEIDFGDWQGAEIEQLKQDELWKKIQDNPSTVRFPGGESFKEAQARIVLGLFYLKDKFEERELVVCVSHGDAIRLAVAHFLGVPLDGFQCLRIAPASITVLHLRENRAFFGPINYVLDFPKFTD